MADITDTTYASNATVGYLAQWKIHQGDGTPGTYTSVAQVSSIQFGDMTANIINKTHLRSPGRAHEKRATIRDLGPFTMTGQLDMTHGSHNNAGGDGFASPGGMIALHRNLTERDMMIVLDDDGSPGVELPFRGVISRLNLGQLTLEGIQEFTADVQPLQDYTATLP